MEVAAGDILESDGIRRGQRSVASQRADELTDEECMTRLSGPEVEAALSALYDRYARTVYGVGLKILGDRSLAEELVQDVFLKVWRSAVPSTLRGELLHLALQGHAQLRDGPLPQARQQGPPASGWGPTHRCCQGFFCRSTGGGRRILAFLAGVEGPGGARRTAPGGDRAGLFWGALPEGGIRTNRRAIGHRQDPDRERFQEIA